MKKSEFVFFQRSFFIKKKNDFLHIYPESFFFQRRWKKIDLKKVK